MTTPDPLFSSKQKQGRWADQAKLRGTFDPPARMREYGNVNIPQSSGDVSGAFARFSPFDLDFPGPESGRFYRAEVGHCGHSLVAVERTAFSRRADVLKGNNQRHEARIGRVRSIDFGISSTRKLLFSTASANHTSVLDLWTNNPKVVHLPLMLNNFFKLDGTPVFHEEGAAMPNMSPGNEVTNVLFRGEKWGKPRTAIKGVTFKNVSIANMEMFQITFTNCSFEDCIFKGSFFHEVEFHKCKFVDCNMWKAKFEKCYLDPTTIFLDGRYRIDASNVGVTMYQALLANYANERQDAFYAQADIEFRRWKRYQLSYEIRKKNVDFIPGHWGRFRSFIFDLLAGYGYKPVRFFVVTVIGFLAISVFNHCVIGNDLLINNQRPPSASLINSIYYSFSVLTVLGFSTVVPDGPFAKLLTVFEALAAIGWLSIFTSILVKRLLR